MPTHPIVLTAPVTVVIAEPLDDTGRRQKASDDDAKRRRELGLGQWLSDVWHGKLESAYARMAYGAVKRLVLSIPIVGIGMQLHHNLKVMQAAFGHLLNGDGALAANAILELPQQNCEAAGSLITGPVEAALAIPGAVRTTVDSQADPEKRGEAAVAAVQAVATVVATIAGAAASAKGKGASPGAARGAPRAAGPTIDKATGSEVGRFVVDSKGNTMIEPVGGSTRAAGRGGVDTHTTYPNGSNYQRLNPQGHPNNPTPHGHGHLPGTGPGMRGQGPSIAPDGTVVPFTSLDAHWPIK